LHWLKSFRAKILEPILIFAVLVRYSGKYKRNNDELRKKRILKSSALKLDGLEVDEGGTNKVNLYLISLTMRRKLAGEWHFERLAILG